MRIVCSCSLCRGSSMEFCNQMASYFSSLRFRSWEGQRNLGFWIFDKMNHPFGLFIEFASARKEIFLC